MTAIPPTPGQDQERQKFAETYISVCRERNEALAHAQRLADALKGLLYSKFEQHAFETARDALAQWEKESPADADALEALEQLEQLEGGE